MITARRVAWLLVGGLLAIVVLGGALLALRVWALYVYAQERTAAYELVAKLSDRRPEDVDAEVWDVATTWAITAYANVCFSEGYVTLDELRRFRADTERRLAGDVDLKTIDWIWQRLAETGPHGQQYRQRFEPQYRDNLNAALATTRLD
jgi:hypothetical protein